MSFTSFCQWLSETPLSRHLREDPYDFPILIIIHIITIALFGGMVVMGNLRVLGKALRSVPVSQVIGQFRSWKWTAFGILLVSGTLLAIADPVEYGQYHVLAFKRAAASRGNQRAGFSLRRVSKRERMGHRTGGTGKRETLGRSVALSVDHARFCGAGHCFFLTDQVTSLRGFVVISYRPM